MTNTPTLADLRRQLQQLRHLHAEGALSDEHFEPNRARLEARIVERVLAGEVDTGTVTSSAGPAPAAAAVAVSPGPSRRVLWGSAAFVIALAVGGYAWFGSPGLWNQRGAAATAEAAPTGEARHSTDAAQLDAMVGKLKARLETSPNDGEGWGMLARSYMVMGRTDDALAAYDKAIALVPRDAAMLADYADALAVRNGRRLEGEPMKWVEKALQIDPDQVKALSLAGTAAFDRQDYKGAVKHWERALQTQSPDSPLLQQLRVSAAEARRLAGLPEAAPVAALGAAAGSSAKADAPASAATLSGTVTLAPALAARASPEDTVFVFARAVEGPRMPLAILRKQVKDLPLTFTLDDAMAMSPQTKLSGFPRVIVGARISKSGNAVAQQGDLQGQTDAVPVGATGLKILIDQAVGG